jgi:hypothetical protein
MQNQNEAPLAKGSANREVGSRVSNEKGNDVLFEIRGLLRQWGGPPIQRKGRPDPDFPSLPAQSKKEIWKSAGEGVRFLAVSFGTQVPPTIITQGLNRY